MFIEMVAALTLGAPLVQAAPSPETPTPPRATPELESGVRQVCRFETVTGSNRRTRVCRNVPRQGVQDQATREFMRDSQRVRMPDQ